MFRLRRLRDDGKNACLQLQRRGDGFVNSDSFVPRVRGTLLVAPREKKSHEGGNTEASHN